MSEDFTLPALGESVTECVITRWLKNIGDRVEVEEPLIEVSTDKVDTEIPAPFSGVIQEILVGQDETAKPGQTLARIKPVLASELGGDGKHIADLGDSRSSVGDIEAPPDTSVNGEDDSVEKPELTRVRSILDPLHTGEINTDSVGSSETESSGLGKCTRDAVDIDNKTHTPYATPIVRQLARELNIDLNRVVGSGPGNRILREDILGKTQLMATGSEGGGITDTPHKISVHGSGQDLGRDTQHDSVRDPVQTQKVPEDSQPGEISTLRGKNIKMSRLRSVIAERAVHSMQNTAQLSTVIEVDLTKLVEYRNSIKEAFKEQEGANLTPMSFIIKAAVLALRKYPVINSHTVDDKIVFPDYENISFAVDTERGLLTPVIKNAGDMTVTQIAKSVSDLARRARNNKLSPDELTGGTFTVTNTGSRGALFDTPVVFLPQLAILGVGVIARRPIVITSDMGESIAIRSVAFFTLSYDHRIIDGADAARFLGYIKSLLEAGEFSAQL